MKSFIFTHEHIYAASQQSALVPIRLRPPAGVPFVVNGLLDSGATVSSFDRALLRPLGITDLTTGTPTKLTAANGDTKDGYIHEITIEFLGRGMSVPVAFCAAWPEGTTNLLGMRGFFDQMVIAFEHMQRRVHVAF